MTIRSSPACSLRFRNTCRGELLAGVGASIWPGFRQKQQFEAAVRVVPHDTNRGTIDLSFDVTVPLIRATIRTPDPGTYATPGRGSSSRSSENAHNLKGKSDTGCWPSCPAYDLFDQDVRHRSSGTILKASSIPGHTFCEAVPPQRAR